MVIAHARSFAVALLASAIATACTVGPDFVRPESNVPARFDSSIGAVDASLAEPAPGSTVLGKATDTAAGTETAAGTATAAGPSAVGEMATPTAPDDRFWRSFDDPLLTQLVGDALTSNHDLRIALARYDRANALLRAARFDTLPTVVAGADATRGNGDGSRGNATVYTGAIDATWELDLFGRIRRDVESRRADALGDAADLQWAQVAIVGEVARTYMTLRGQQERLRVAVDNQRNQQQTLQLVDARLDAGRGTEFDTSRARAQSETTAARIPALEAAIAVDMNRLAVLTGRNPGALRERLEPVAALPALPGDIAPGTPADLLRRRPDIAAAEARLHSATALVGVATADLFPRVTLGGLVGGQIAGSGPRSGHGDGTQLVALGIDWSFLDIGRVRARIAAADADAAGGLARYQQVVLLALEDTQDALLRYTAAQREDGHLEQAAIASAQAARLARVRFDAGAIDLFEVLDAERTQLQAQDAFADSRTRSAVGAVRVYTALAGGWPDWLPTSAATASLH